MTVCSDLDVVEENVHISVIRRWIECAQFEASGKNCLSFRSLAVCVSWPGMKNTVAKASGSQGELW
jgi:hypothetical protein